MHRCFSFPKRCLISCFMVCLAVFHAGVDAQILTQAAPQAEATSKPISAVPKDKLLSLEVVINGSNSGTWVILERNDVLYASRAAFTQWRIAPRDKPVGLSFRGENYLALTSISGFEGHLNSATQTLHLQLPATAFDTTRVREELATRAATDPALLSGFLTYDVSATRNQASQSPAASTDVSALLELGVTGQWGVLSSSYVGRNLLNSSPLGVDRSLRRLETGWTYNMPLRNETLRLGDAVTSRGLWGRELYFGGLQWGTNYGLSPGMTTHALPVVSGVSSAPSTVELYVNDALRQVSKVPAGPFTIDNFPAVSGSGDARIVIKDILGRETVLIQPFLTHQELLATDLNAWHVSLGRLRQNLGLDNDSYGAGFAAGQWRRGWSPSVTTEAKLELSRATQTAGMGLTFALPGQHVASLAWAQSHDKDHGGGHLAVANLSRVSEVWGYTLQAQRATDGFRSLGQVDALGWQYSLSSHLRINAASQLGAAWTSSASAIQSRLQTFNVTWTQKIGDRNSLVATLTKLKGANIDGAGWALGLNLLVPLDGGRQFTASTTARPGGASQSFVSASGMPQGDDGTGWRALAGHRDSQAYAEAGYYMQGRQGMLTADIQGAAQQQTLRLGAQGGLLLTQGLVFATPRHPQSYAVAEVKGYPDVGVSGNGRSNGVTNPDGIQLIMSLSPYQANAIRLNPQDLPISAELNNIEVSVNPPWRGVVKADFPVRAGRAALLRIVFDDGQPAPAAAVVAIDHDKEQFYVARRGEAYVTGLETSNQLTLTWKEQSCRLVVVLPATNRDTIPRLEPIVCKGVPR